MGIQSTQKFEEKYKEDFKLEHTKLDHILFYDEEEKQYINADMRLFGKSFSIRTYDDYGELWKEIKGSNIMDILEYRIFKISDDMIVMEIGNSEIQVYYYNYLLIKEHYDKINANHLEEMLEVAMGIEQCVNDIIDSDEEMIMMIMNFFNEMPLDLFVNPILITQIEAFLVYKYKNGASSFLMLSDEIKRACYSEIEVNQVGNKIYEEIKLENEGLVVSYFSEGLFLLFELFKDRYSIDIDNIPYVVYLLINKLIKLRLSKEWEKEYSEYFNEITTMDLGNAVESYLYIDTINHDNIYTAGKFIYYLMTNNIFKNNNNYVLCYDEFVDVYNEAKKKQKMDVFKRKLLKKREEDLNTITIDDIDLMNGVEFEQFISQLFVKQGYTTEITKQSGDQGIDVICEKNSIKIGIQAKCYTGTVGNAAVQEAVAGKKYYRLDKVMVITNSVFSNSAIELANSNDVVLWDRNLLKEKLI